MVICPCIHCTALFWIYVKYGSIKCESMCSFLLSTLPDSLCNETIAPKEIDTN